MRRRRFTREFEVEGVKLVWEREISVAQAARDLDVHENVLRKWVKELGSDPVQDRVNSAGSGRHRGVRHGSPVAPASCYGRFGERSA
jgi:transposase